MTSGLLLALLSRDLRNRYNGSVAGALWLLIQPLMLLGVYALVFGVVFRASLGPTNTQVPYVAYIAVALWPWLAFSEAVLRGVMAVQQQGALVKKVAFSSETLVVSAVLASFVVHIVGSVLVVLALAFTGINIHMLGLPLYYGAFLALIVPALGLALALSATQVFVRDVEPVVQQLMTVAFYATPVLYSVSMVPDWLQSLVVLNPVGQIIEASRAALLGVPGPDFASPAIALSLLSFVVVLLAGRWVFSRLSPHFEDTL